MGERVVSWKADKAKSDMYLPEIKCIVGACLISEPPLEEDQLHNTDLIVLKLESVRIACRVRDASYARSFGDEFTIRDGRPSGAKTELAKIIEGWGQYIFYGFGNGSRLTKWRLGDLNVFRLAFVRHLASRKEMMGQKKKNHDNSSSFRVFRWSDFPSDFVVGCSETKNFRP